MGKRTIGHMQEINDQIALGFTKRDADTLRSLLQRAHANLTV
jgi:hypothetical protein